MVSFAIFNELSLPLDHNSDIKNTFGEFFKLLSQLKTNSFGYISTLRTSLPIKDYQITKNDNFQSFLGKQTDREFRQRLRDFIVNTVMEIDNPLIKDNEEDQKEQLLLSEYMYDEEKAYSLGCAKIWNTIAIIVRSGSIDA